MLLSCAVALACAAITPAAASAAWLTPDATAALQEHSAKVMPGFQELTAAVPAGAQTRVYGTLADRGPATRDFLASHTDEFAFAESFDGFIAAVRAEQIDALLESPRVRTLEAHRPAKLMLARSARESQARDALWSFAQDGNVFPGALSSLHPVLGTDTATGRGVAIAVNDSGIDGTHRDFGGFDCIPAPYLPCQTRIARKVVLDQRLGLGVDVTPQTTDYASGHGTHVAGIAAGNGSAARDGDAQAELYGADGIPIGVAPQADLVSIKSGDTDVLLNAWQGIDWVAAHAAEYGIRVVNNSWGCDGGCPSVGGFSFEAIKAAYDNGVLVTFAAGNDYGTGGGAEFSGDSQSPYSLSVANYDPANLRLAESSSRGVNGAPMPDPATWTPESEPATGYRRPDIAAPGTAIFAAHNLTGGTAALTPRANGNDVVGGGSFGYYPYVAMGGTSMSAPHVAGVGALLFAACPDARVLDVMRALMASANATRVLKTAGSATAEPFEVGYGALDAKAAMDWLGANVDACSHLSPNAAPTAAIAAPDTATATEAVTFDAGGSSDDDGIVSYAWDFGDGALASGATASHAYARSGTYTVTLTVSDAEGLTATATRTVTVANAAPAAGIATVDGARALAAAAFDGRSSADRDGVLTAYAWDFGDGATATGPQPSHVYAWAGEYVVRLTVTDDEGATATATRTITVTDAPASGFKRLNASGLTNHKCDGARWTFQLKPVLSGDAPASVAVLWADGSRERVARTSYKSGTALYTTTRALSEIATKAWADVPSTSTAALSLASGPCQ